MLFVWIGFFNRLGLTLVAEPLSHVADSIARVAPSVLHAGLIFVAAWILAGLLRWLVVKTLTRLDVERRFGHFFVPDGTDPRGLAQTMGTLAFYLVLLLAVPPFLAALGQSALVAPLSEMLRVLLSYVPNVAAAAISIGLGWVVARILRQVVRSLLVGVNLDRGVERVGLAPTLGAVRLSALVGTIVYFVVWIPFIIAGLDALKIEAISRPAINALETLLGWVPKGLGGAVLLILAWAVSRLVGDLVTQLLRGVGFDQVPARLGLAALQSPGARTPSDFVGAVVRMLVLVFASVETFEVIGLHRLAGFGDRLVAFMINVVIATAIVGVGLWAGNLVQGLVGRPLERTGTRNPRTIAAIAKYAVVVFAFAMALQQIGFGEMIVVWAFVLLFGAVCLALALAFGLGSREAAARAVARAIGEGAGSGPRPGSA
jgi:hypothetical protein